MGLHCRKTVLSYLLFIKMKIQFDSGPIFDLTIKPMDNPNSQLDPQDELRDLIQIDPREVTYET